jgi:sugar phosphate isomerase/epimerase
LIPLGVAHLTALELSPPQFVVGAAEAGFRSVGFRMHPAMAGGAAYPSHAGTQTHRELRNLLRDKGVVLNDVEFVQLTPDVDVGSFMRMLEAGADLGAASVTVSGDDPDKGRLVANFAALCDLTAPLDLRVDMEFMQWRVIGTLAQAKAIVSAAGKPNSAILLDALHLIRSGGAPADVRKLPAGSVKSAQLCDASADPPKTDEAVISEAREGRLPPGDGALPLVELLGALPPGVAFSVEMPMPKLNAQARLVLAYDATRRVLQRASVV